MSAASVLLVGYFGLVVHDEELEHCILPHLFW